MELFGLYDNCAMELKSNFIEALQLDLKSQKVLAFVGAGGKTSCIFQLADELIQFGKRVIITTTTHMYRPKKYGVLDENKEKILKMLEIYNIAIVGIELGQAKISGVSEDTFIWLLDQADYILVEADGSKRLPLKVPNNYEPVLPPVTDEVVILAGLSGLYKPVNEVCHRYELAAKILNSKGGHKVTPKDIALLIKTYLQDKDQVYHILLNQSENEKHTKEAMEIQSYLKEYRCILRTYHPGSQEVEP